MTQVTTQSETAPAKIHGADSLGLSVLDRIAKRAVVSRLDQLTQGRICLQDASSTSTHGTLPESAQHNPSVHALRVHNPVMYRQSVLGGGLGFAESYLEGDWDCDNLTELLRVFVRDIQLTHANDRKLGWLIAPSRRFGEFINRNTRSGSKRNIAAHYDLGNDFFELFLDETMTYSSGLFEHPDSTMKDASIAKLDRICKKLNLQPSDHVLETGTGWGSFAIHSATHYGCKVTTTTISQQQHDLAKQRIQSAGLSDRVTLLLEDYRTLQGQYDKIVSIEMIEAVGHRYLDTYLGACSNLLKDDGQMMLQVISMPSKRYRSYLRTTDFIRKHVFPGSC
ncbi:MAG: class I SAM-dependent methyltransferase, partial [Phycisphaerales bacterium]|nr:class I SAM-dependent methyltransferase [Phycisphaerales bacterium]